MSDSKNPKDDNLKTGNTEKKKTEEVKKTEPVKAAKPIHGVKVESSKSDRLDRMENQLSLIEDGLLVLINSVQWHNLSITPIGTHNPQSLIDGYTSLQEAVKELNHDGQEQCGAGKIQQ